MRNVLRFSEILSLYKYSKKGKRIMTILKNIEKSLWEIVEFVTEPLLELIDILNGDWETF